MFMGNKRNHLAIIIIFYSIWSLCAIISLSGCSGTIPSASTPKSCKVTLLWNEIPGAISYNVYVSKTPGVTRLSGSKISNATNSLWKIWREYPAIYGGDETSSFKKDWKSIRLFAWQIDESYTAVAGKIGLIYWKNLFDKSIQDHKSNTDETRQEIKATPERTKTEAERPPLENDSKPATVHIETGTDPKLLVLEEKRLRVAQMLAESAFFIFFEQNSNELSPKAIEKLDRIYEILANNSAAKLTLNGYSDSIGTPSYNQMVSEIRAISVKSYLSGKGIKPSRMMTFGHGAQKFIASNKSAEGRRLNRRVEIELIIPWNKPNR